MNLHVRIEVPHANLPVMVGGVRSFHTDGDTLSVRTTAGVERYEGGVVVAAVPEAGR